MKKPNKLKEMEETKTDRARLNKTGRRKHLQAAFQSIIIPLGVEYERERVQFCSGYHYHHGYNHNQGNSSVGDGKADGTG